MRYVRHIENVPLGFFTELETAVKKFAEKKYPGYVCQIDEIEEDSSGMGMDFGARVDIWLRFSKFSSPRTISDCVQQKVFLINGELMDCLQYRKYLDKQEVSAS